MTSTKLFIGPRLRRLRRDRGLSQSAMAAELAISPSYLNHLEAGTRPVTAPLLLRLAERYEIDVKRLAADSGAATSTDQLTEIFGDELLSDLGVPRYELVELAQKAPTVAEGIARLYVALTEKRRDDALAGIDGGALVTPEVWVRDFIQMSHNHFPELEASAETLGGALSDALSVAEPLRRRLKEAWGISVRVAQPAELGNASQYYDPERRQFSLSALLRAENRTLKRALTDPHVVAAVGNAYSDEILHRARLSPMKCTRDLDDAGMASLRKALREVLQEWIARLRAEVGAGWPKKVTAFRPEMSVHGRFGKPCPVCGAPVQRIVYAENEANYCAPCQTGGRLLADRGLSRLLKDDWPRTLEELEERKRTARG